MVYPMRLQPHEIPYAVGTVGIVLSLARLGMGVWRVHRDDCRPGKADR